MGTVCMPPARCHLLHALSPKIIIDYYKLVRVATLQQLPGHIMKKNISVNYK
jgi:hypothetical protein